jgi:inositol oxygenase
MGTQTNGPLESLDQWDDDVRARYRADRKKEEFRVYDDTTPQVVRDFYQQNHALQTLEFARAKRAEYEPLQKAEMGIWEAMDRLNELVDDSDPDTDLSQIQHNLQTAEAIRADGHPRWFVLTGFIHDLGKVLTMWGEPQWAVVGDTFPVGCRWSDKIVYPQYFEANPDSQNPELMTRYGVYDEQCGLDKVNLSWGHDEYLYHVTKNYLPEEAQYMIRYHSWYSAHREMDYQFLMSDHDMQMMDWVRKFNPYDLYSKSAVKPDFDQLKPYYDDLISEFFPAKIKW